MRLDETLEQLEDVLMTADIGATTTDEIITDLRSIAVEDKIDPDDIKSVLRGRLVSVLEGGGAVDGAEDENPRAIKFASPEEGIPTVLMVIGANGMYSSFNTANS